VYPVAELPVGEWLLESHADNRVAGISLNAVIYQFVQGGKGMLNSGKLSGFTRGAVLDD